MFYCLNNIPGSYHGTTNIWLVGCNQLVFMIHRYVINVIKKFTINTVPNKNNMLQRELINSMTHLCAISCTFRRDGR
jgi:hypothetical protein